jgi:hypothetical protein
MSRLMVGCIVALTAATLAAQAGMGIQYKGQVKIEGGAAEQQRQQAQKMSPEEKEQMRRMGFSMEGAQGYDFLAQADGGKFKMTYLTPFMMFPKDCYMLGDSKMKMVYFVFPEKKQYTEMDLDKMQDLAKSMKVKISNGKCTVTPLPPKLINGEMCPGKRVELSYDSEATVMGFHSKTHEERKTDCYTTDKYDALVLFGGRNWQNIGTLTGDAAFDAEIKAKVGFLGFPVQIVSHHLSNGKDMGTTTMTTMDVQMRPFTPGTFELPAGYAKVGMMGAMGAGTVTGGEQEEGEEGGQPQKAPNLKDLLKGLEK